MIQEIDEIISLLEARIPANPSSRENERQASKLEKVLRDYFGGLEQAFPYEQLEQLYHRYATEEKAS